MLITSAVYTCPGIVYISFLVSYLTFVRNYGGRKAAKLLYSLELEPYDNDCIFRQYLPIRV